MVAKTSIVPPVSCLAAAARASREIFKCSCVRGAMGTGGRAGEAPEAAQVEGPTGGSDLTPLQDTVARRASTTVDHPT